jgi:ATP-binding cassette, subfamily B, multidrug efflux pump
MMMEVVGDVLLPYMLAKIINQGIAEKNVAYIIKIGAIMGLISVIMAVSGVLGAWFASKAAMNFGADLRMDLFEKIQQFSFQNIDNFINRAGELPCIGHKNTQTSDIKTFKYTQDSANHGC